MSSAAFDAFFEHLMEFEGGYANDPDDPGGETIYGITRRDHPDLWANGPPTEEQARERARRDYWNPVHGDALPQRIALVVADCAYNVGAGEAVKILQEQLGFEGGDVDGDLGPKTLRALENAAFGAMAAAYNSHRSAWYRGLARGNPKKRKFLKGWLARADKLTRMLREGG